MLQRRSRRPAPTSTARWLPAFERLEDRTTPAVTAVQSPAGVVTVTLDADGDSAFISGADPSGTTITVTGAADPFTNVTGIAVVDGGTNANQTVTFNDSGPGDKIAVSGAVTTTGIEQVVFDTADAPLHAGNVSVTAASTGIQFLSDVTTTAASGQTYDGPVTLSEATVTLDAGASGGISFSQSVNSDAVTGPNALVLNAGGTTSFTGILGGVHPLASLTTDAAGTTQIGANVSTVGAQNYNDPVVLAGATITLTTTGAGGDIDFAGTLNAQTAGTNSLVESASGVATFGGIVGATPLGGLQTTAAAINFAANVTTTGQQAYTGPVTVSGSSITFTSAVSATLGSNIAFNGTLDGAADNTTALIVNTTTGTTTFRGNVGATHPLASIATDAGTGTTVIGPNATGTPATAVSITTSGTQLYNDPVKLQAQTVNVNSTNAGNLTFNSTVDGAAFQVAATFKTDGATNFVGVVGGTTPLDTIATANNSATTGTTVIHASITTTDTQNFANAVTFTPATGITSQRLTSINADIDFQSTLGGASAVPVTIAAGANAAFNGNATFSASGSRLNVQGASVGAGSITFATGLTFDADVQTWQAGSGSGTAAAANLATNAPSFRNADGTKAPQSFVLRQDSAITDADIPPTSQFGTAVPANYTIISDGSTLTLTNTTDLASAATANLTLASQQTLSLGATINAPNGVVRLRSLAASVTQTGGSIAAAGLGVQSGTAITLVGSNAVAGAFAASSTTTNIQFANGSPFIVGTIGADPLATIFTQTSGVTAAAGSVTFTQPGSSPLNITIDKSVSGSSVTVTGGSAADSVTVNYALGGALPNGLTFNGNGGNDTLSLSDVGSTTAHIYLLGATAVRDSAAAINYSGVESVQVTGGSSGDNFTITPDPTASFTVAGGLPTGATGDTMSLTLTGTTSPTLTASKASDGFQGSATFSNRAAVNFSQMESLAPQADIQVMSTASAALIPLGGTVTFTLVVKNAGTSTATGTQIDDVLPAGFTATWTATASSGSTVTDASGTGDIHTTASIAAAGTITFTVTAKANAGFLGSVTNTMTASASTSAFDTNTANNSASSTVTVEAVSLLAVGAGAGGGPEVKVFNADGSVRFNFFAYDPAYLGGVTVATGDVNGDGVEDIVTGSAQGSSHVEVFDGASGNLLASFFAFPGFTGGVNVAVADGMVIAGAGVGGGPIFSGFTLGSGGATQTFSMFAYDPSFRGGVEVAGSSDLITVGAGPGGGPNVKVFDAASRSLVSSFFAFLPGVANGMNVGMGMLGGRETVIAGAGEGVPPTVATFDAHSGQQISSVLGFEADFFGGVRTASTTTSTGQQGTVVAPGPGGSPRIRILDPNGDEVSSFFAFDPSFRGGVFVG